MEQEFSNKLRLLIVEARFYEQYSDDLLKGAKKELGKAGVTYDIVTVPGALEIPAVIAFAAKGQIHYDGYVALGCIMRGATYHFDIVANESCRGLTSLSVDQNLAIGNGILTVENDRQARERVDETKKNKGGFAVKAALTLIAIKKKFGAC
ncbi:MAG: Riboflavin synthase beta-chain [Candidatus Tokpelaia sp. JSC085]|nr:MAG: Riboflavin synthase beta-chain [Candidatus Tokpelaia sp. JSC085]